MKKNIHKCDKCDHEMKSAKRDPGNEPARIGCVIPKCKGFMNTFLYLVDQELEPVYIFFKPKTPAEWKLVEDQVLFELRRDLPRINGKKMIRKKTKAMNLIRLHIGTGGLVYLPKTIVDN